MSVTLNGTSGLVFGDGTVQGTAGYTPFRNRIINGNMAVDQRLSGTFPVTINSSGYTYAMDRWAGYGTAAAGTFSITRVTDAPNDFEYSAKITVGTADTSLAATDIYIFRQAIEGNNTYDFAWGTADAKTVAMSFWVKSSVAGTYSFCLTSNSYAYYYPASYTINATNTWEYKTVIIPGQVAASWKTGVNTSMQIMFGLGIGTTYTDVAGAWTTKSGVAGANGCTNLMAATGATWQITGVQLEKATAASTYEHRPFSVEYALCRRYYQQSTVYGAQQPAPGISSTRTGIASIYNGTAAESCIIPFNVPMRVFPTMTYTRPAHSSGHNNAWANYQGGSSWYYPTSANVSSMITEHMFSALLTASGTNGTTGITEGGWIANAEL